MSIPAQIFGLFLLKNAQNLIPEAHEQFSTVVAIPRPKERSSVEVVLDPSINSVDAHVLVIV